MLNETTRDFRAGYEAGKRDAIDRCLIEKVAKDYPEWHTHNVAINRCILAIRALDVRHTIGTEEIASE